MIVGVLTTCHTQYTWNRSICIFLFNITTLQVFVTYLTGALYVHPLWFYIHQHDNRVRNWPTLIKYKHTKRLLTAAVLVNWAPSGEMRNYCIPHIIKENFLIHRCNYILLSQVYCVWQVVKTPTIIFNNPVFKVTASVSLLNHGFSTGGTRPTADIWGFPITIAINVSWACNISIALLWVITERVVIIYYRRFGTTYRSHLQGPRIQKRSLEITTIRCVTTQKITVLIYFAEEACNYASTYVDGLKISLPRPYVATLSTRFFFPKLVHLS